MSFILSIILLLFVNGFYCHKQHIIIISIVYKLIKFKIFHNILAYTLVCLRNSCDSDFLFLIFYFHSKSFFTQRQKPSSSLPATAGKKTAFIPLKQEIIKQEQINLDLIRIIESKPDRIDKGGFSRPAG